MKKVLLIEDHDEVRENIEEILCLSGYEVLAAENGKVGVTLAKLHRPDLILCDVSMPQLDGFGVLQILHKDASTFDIPFIFLTARVEPSDFRKGMGLGADDYITKPFDDTELLQAIETRLQKAERLKEQLVAQKLPGKQLFSEARAWQQLERITEGAESEAFLAKELIYSEGAFPRYVYFIVSGRVKFIRVNEFGKELITHIYHKEELFGYHSIFDSEPYPESAVAIEPTVVKRIAKDKFLDVLYTKPELLTHMIKLIAREASQTEQHLLDHAYSSVRKKAANALLTFIQPDQCQKEPVVISATRDDLANVAGTAKETLIRTLSDFKSEGLISVQGSDITILELDALKKLPQ